MGDPLGGGGAAELKPMASHSTSFAEPNPIEIGMENWATAHRAALEIIRKVQPTSVSEVRRKEVVDYIQRLIRNCLGAEVKILSFYMSLFNRFLLLDTFILCILCIYVLLVV